MYINEPNGKNYLKLSIENDLLKIQLLKYKEPTFLSIDRRCIPDLIEALEEFKDGLDTGN